MSPTAASNTPTLTSSSVPAGSSVPGYRPRKTNWNSVRLLNVYRLGLAAIFFAQSFINPSPLVNIVDLSLYSWTSLAFLVLALIWMVASAIERRGFQKQISLQIYSDTIILILLMHACGGISSGLGMLLIISVVVTGLLTEQSLAILFASLASLGLLAEHVYSSTHLPAYTGTSTQVGILGASLIATAFVTHKLVMRARSSEQLIQQRERDVALLSALNQEIIENMQAGVIVLGRSNNIRHINRAAREMLNLPSHRPISMHEDCSALLQTMEEWQESSLPTGIPLLHTTEIGNLQISFRQLISDGQPNTMIFLNDISSIRNSMQQAKLASLGHLTASIAHEIRNPLGAISYAAELLNEDNKLDDGNRRMIEIINQHTHRINHIIEDILNISRGSSTSREHVDLKPWLEEFIDRFYQSGHASPGLFQLKFETESTGMTFDAGHFDQILTNLCTNACIHGNVEKPITIRVYLDAARETCIEIADQGPGISDEALQQIFEPFFTTSHQGSGLGLYIVSQLCELNNTSISASANANQGTTFLLKIGRPGHRNCFNWSPMSKQRILIVDDEPDIRELLEITLMRMGLDTRSAEDYSEATRLLVNESFDLCLTDMKLPDGDGIALVEYIQQHCPSIPTAVITAHGSIDLAIKAMKCGAFDFVSKPVSLDTLRNLVDKALTLPAPAEVVEQAIDDRYQIIGDSAPMLELKKSIAKFARSQAPVFINGASGTGKELVARQVHLQGARAKAPFIAVNCGAIPSELMESELFGHLKGSFTGATSDNEGLFKAAQGGTLFLDEIADLPLAMQVKLLRVIQEKSIRAVGTQQEESIDVRIISASHKDLEAMVDSGEFRQDLYYRINVIGVSVPPLAERSQDIGLFDRISDQ